MAAALKKTTVKLGILADTDYFLQKSKRRGICHLIY